MWKRSRPVYAPETGAGSGEGGQGQSTAVQGSHDESTAADRGQTQTTLPERPEWVPENFWNKDKGEADYEGMAKSWGDLRKKVSMRSDDLEKKVKEDLDKSRLAKRPEKPESYELRLPEGIPEEGWEWNEADPLVGFARNLAFESGMGQDEFDNLVSAYVESKIAELPDVEAETKRLGEKGQERIERIDNWMKANISPGSYAALSSVSTKAEVIVALEEMMQKAGAPAFVVGTDLTTGDQEVMSDALVRTWMADPRYWDPRQRDGQFVAKVEKAWQKLYPAKK